MIEVKINDNMIGQWIVDLESTWRIEEIGKDYVRINIGGKLIEINKNFDPLPTVPSENQQGNKQAATEKKKRIIGQKTTNKEVNAKPWYASIKQIKGKFISLPITLETNPSQNPIIPGDINVGKILGKNNLKKFTELPTPLPGISVDWFTLKDIDYNKASFAYLSTGEFPFGRNGEKMFSRKVESLNDISSDFTDWRTKRFEPFIWICNPLTILSSTKSQTTLKYKNLKITIPTKDILPYIVNAPFPLVGNCNSLRIPNKRNAPFICKKTIEVANVERNLGFLDIKGVGKVPNKPTLWVEKANVQHNDTVNSTLRQNFYIGEVYGQDFIGRDLARERGVMKPNSEISKYFWNTATEPPPSNIIAIKAGYMKDKFLHYKKEKPIIGYYNNDTAGIKLMAEEPKDNVMPLTYVEYVHLWE